MAPRSTSKAAEPEPVRMPVTVHGCNVWEAPTFLGPLDDSNPEWYSDLQRRHIEACAEFAETATATARIDTDSAETMRAWRRALRKALAVGEPAPPRPEVAIAEAEREALLDDVLTTRELVAGIIVEALDEIRKRRAEIVDVVISTALSDSLRAGPLGLHEPTSHGPVLRPAEVAKLADTEAGVEVIDDRSPLQSTETEVANV